MPGVKPDKLLAKAPVPLPSTVLEFEVVGFEVVFQQTPRAVTLAPPSKVTFPPLIAEVVAMALTAVVTESTGAVGFEPGGVGESDLLQPSEIKNAVMIVKTKLIFIKSVLDDDLCCYLQDYLGIKLVINLISIL